MRVVFQVITLLLLFFCVLPSNGQDQDLRYVDINKPDTSVQQQTQDQDEQLWATYDQDNIDVPPQALPDKTPTSEPLKLTGERIYILGEDSNGNLKAYGANYPGTTLAAVQTLEDTQSEYTEQLASTDVYSILGAPTSDIIDGSGTCRDGERGQVSSSYHPVKTAGAVKAVVVVKYCNDGLQSVAIKKIN